MQFVFRKKKTRVGSRIQISKEFSLYNSCNVSLFIQFPLNCVPKYRGHIWHDGQITVREKWLRGRESALFEHAIRRRPFLQCGIKALSLFFPLREQTVNIEVPDITACVADRQSVNRCHRRIVSTNNNVSHSCTHISFFASQGQFANRFYRF